MFCGRAYMLSATYGCAQWRSQGEGQWGQLPPVGLDSGKVIVGSVVHAAELN